MIEMNRINRFLSGEVRVRVRGSEGRVLEINYSVQLVANFFHPVPDYDETRMSV